MVSCAFTPAICLFFYDFDTNLFYSTHQHTGCHIKYLSEILETFSSKLVNGSLFNFAFSNFAKCKIACFQIGWLRFLDWFRIGWLRRTDLLVSYVR